MLKLQMYDQFFKKGQNQNKNYGTLSLFKILSKI